MKKSHYKSHFETFEQLEQKTLEDFRTRRALTNDEEDFRDIIHSTMDPEDENAVIIPENLTQDEEALLEEACLKIEDTDDFRAYRAHILKEMNRMENYLRPGKKYPLLARNPVRVKQGRRFAYVGVDGDIHIGRNGKPLRVPMATA